MISEKKGGETLGMFLIGITVFLWSTIEVITKLIHGALPPLTIAFLRFFIGGVFLLPVVFIFSGRIRWASVGFRDWTMLVLLSFLGISITFTLFHIALDWIDASSAATLISMVPLATVPLSMILLREKVAPLALAGFILGGIGVFLIFLSEERSIDSLIAVAMMIMAVSCFAVYSVLMKPLNRRLDPKVTTSLSLLIGAVLMIPILLIAGAPLYRPVSGFYLLHLGFLSFVSVGIAYLVYFIGLDMVDVSRGNSLIYLKPFMAAILAVLFIGELPSVLRISGILFVMVSVYLVLKEKPGKRK